MNTETNTPSPGLDGSIARALEAFRTSGSIAPILDALGHPEKRQALLLLQHHLGHASSRADRDALEDVAWWVSEGSVPPEVLFPWSQADLERLIELNFGKEARAHLRAEDALNLLRSLWRRGISGLPENGMLAILSVEIARRVGNVISVEASEFGKSLTYHSTHCRQCGGTQGGGGWVVCTHCVAAVLGKFKGNPAGSISEDMVRDLIIARPQDHGCAACGRQPARRCDCAWTVDVPAQVRDGQVVVGRSLSSGTAKPAVIRLDGK